PAVHGAERELAPGGAPAKIRLGVEQPRDLGAREVRVQDEPGPGPDERLEPRRSEPLAERSRAPALPDDRPGDRRPGPPVPHERRLALVGGPDRPDLSRGDP